VFSSENGKILNDKSGRIDKTVIGVAAEKND